MSGSRTRAIALRTLRQLRRDPRSVVLVLGMPLLLLGILHEVLPRPSYDSVAPMLIGIFPLTLMTVVTSITMLRERTSGTLERLMSMPMGKGDLLLGYGLAFGALGIVQALLATGFAVGPLGVPLAGSTWLLVLFAVCNSQLGTAFGLFASAFARTEFQAVQMMPLVVFPQILLCGLFGPRDDFGTILHAISQVMPMTWAVDGLARVAAGEGLGTPEVVRDLAIVLGCVVALLLLGAGTLRRRTE